MLTCKPIYAHIQAMKVGERLCPIRLPRCRWALPSLYLTARVWRKRLDKKKASAGARSSFWSFISDWHQHLNTWLVDFIAGDYQFGPMTHCYFMKENMILWSFQNRLFLSLLHRIIKPAHFILSATSNIFNRHP